MNPIPPGIPKRLHLLRLAGDVLRVAVFHIAAGSAPLKIAVEFNVAKSSVSKWVNEYKEECLYTTSTSSESNEAKEIRRLNQLLNEKNKEIAFLKKAAAFFVKEID